MLFSVSMSCRPTRGKKMSEEKPTQTSEPRTKAEADEDTASPAVPSADVSTDESPASPPTEQEQNQVSATALEASSNEQEPQEEPKPRMLVHNQTMAWASDLFGIYWLKAPTSVVRSGRAEQSLARH